MNEQLQREREAEVKSQQAARSSENANAGSGVSKGWNEEDLQLLIKAVNLFPAGTNARLDTHTPSSLQSHGAIMAVFYNAAPLCPSDGK